VTDPQTMAETLIRAERERAPVAPFTHTNPFLNVENAYRVQTLVVEHRLLAGEQLIGIKLGLTSKVKRRALGIHEPVYGRLTTGMVVPFGEPLRLGGLINPKAEPELALLFGRAVGPDMTVTSVLRAVEQVLPAIEVMDSRYSGSFRLPDSVADNAGAARIIIGTVGRSPGELVDLSVLGCVFRHRGGIDTAAGGAVMGHPAAAIVWLARVLAGRGQHLPAGAIVMTGGLTASVRLRPGDTVTAEFDGLGSVGVRCS
jgi:2-oxo-3-hexenedioate decarboxylase